MNINGVLIMIGSVLFSLVVITACAPDLINKDVNGNLLPTGVKKFSDGNVTCWIYHDKEISCVQNR